MTGVEALLGLTSHGPEQIRGALGVLVPEYGAARPVSSKQSSPLGEVALVATSEVSN